MGTDRCLRLRLPPFPSAGLRALAARARVWPYSEMESSSLPKPPDGLRELESPMKTAPVNEVKDALSKYLRMAEKEDIVITRHGKPAGVLVGFASEEDWFDYRLEHDPRFLRRIERARESLQAGTGLRLEDVGL